MARKASKNVHEHERRVAGRFGKERTESGYESPRGDKRKKESSRSMDLLPLHTHIKHSSLFHFNSDIMKSRRHLVFVIGLVLKNSGPGGIFESHLSASP